MLIHSIPFDRLYCYAQKHVRSIKAVTKDPGEIAEKRYRSIRRLNKPNKKLKIRNFHHSSPYHVSDHKAAITVGVIMGVFLGKPSTLSSIPLFILEHSLRI
jgi:dopamine receptor D1